jgi:nitronate monooxygenase
MRTLQDLLGIELPIIQAPLAGAQDSVLAIAVSNAGGVGSLPCAMLSAEQMRAELTAIEAGTDRPFNVNFFCHTPPVPNAERESIWRKILEPYYRELGLDQNSAVAATERAPFSAEAADILEDFGPPIVSFHFGLPSPALLARVRGWGAKILSSATTVDEALWLEARGIDAIIAQGLEAGGHRGHFLSDDLTRQLTTFTLIPQIVQAVNVPVIAAGGIADARGVAAAHSLGAAGVQPGTAYLLCPEATTSSVHRAALTSDAARHTALTNLFSGRPARGIMNRLMRELGPLNSVAPEFPLATAALAPLRAKAEKQGRSDFSPLWAGQNASACRAISAAELTCELGAESHRGTLNNASPGLGPQLPARSPS